MLIESKWQWDGSRVKGRLDLLYFYADQESWDDEWSSYGWRSTLVGTFCDTDGRVSDVKFRAQAIIDGGFIRGNAY